ncbi:MAG: hypothetical protein K1X50_12900 [Candidatus Promineofilum sp.]|nr:hypothetical protein [Promineifilum sp.]
MTADQRQQTTDADGVATTEADGRVYEPPSFDDLKWPPESVHTYAQLYEKLVRQCSHEETWGSIQRLLFYFFFPAFLVATALLDSSHQERWYVVWEIVIAFLLASLAMSVVFTAWLMNRNAMASVVELAAKLIVATRSPRTGWQGLTALDVSRLRHTATIEQQAADWRGSVVTTVIFALVLTAFTAAVRTVTPDIIESMSDSWGDPAFPAWTDFLRYSVIVGMTAYVGFSLLDYFRRFTNREIANRIVLMATTEALAALEDCGLDSAASLTMREKRIAITRLGYQLSPEPLSHRWSDEFFMSYFGRRPSPVDWYLEPLSPKTQPYPIEFILLPLYLLGLVTVASEKAVYSRFLRVRSRLRRRTTELLGKEVKWPVRRDKERR